MRPTLYSYFCKQSFSNFHATCKSERQCFTAEKTRTLRETVQSTELAPWTRPASGLLGGSNLADTHCPGLPTWQGFPRGRQKNGAMGGSEV